MKKYVKPQLKTEEFVAQEYVAACYIVKCSVGNNITLWLEDNGKPGLQRNDETRTITMSTPQCGRNEGWFHTHTTSCYEKEEIVRKADTRLASGNGCGTEHKGVLKNPELNGYVTSNYSSVSPSSPNCFIFNQAHSGGSDWHGSMLNAGDVDSSNPKAS